MTLAKLKAGGPFGVNDELTSVEMNILNDEIQNALDAINGGSFLTATQAVMGGGAAATPLKIVGTFETGGLVGTGTFQFSAGGAFTGAHSYFVGSGATLNVQSGGIIVFAIGTGFTCGATTTFTGAAGFTATNLVTGTATWEFEAGSTVSFASLPTFSAGLTVSAGTSTFSGPATFPGGITGGVQFANSVACNDNLTCFDQLTIDLGGTLRFASSGHAQYRYVFGANANHTYAVTDTDIVFVRDADMSGDHTYTMSNTGCVGGEIIELSTDSTTRTMTIMQHDGTTAIAFLKFAVVASNYKSMRIMNDGSGSASSSWRLLSFSQKAV